MRPYFILPFIIIVFNHCSFFGSERLIGKVKSYNRARQEVITDKGVYRVGKLPSPWRQKSFTGAAISFFHSEYQASINTQSYCDSAVSDIGLEFLMRDLYQGLKNLKQERRHEFVLANREALRSIFSGTVDGLKALVDAVGVKKDNCLVEFYLVTPAANYDAVKSDFESFYQAFELKLKPKAQKK